VNLILIDSSELAPDGTVTLRDARARHIRQVLKTLPGETVRIGAIDGATGVGTVTVASDEAVALVCTWGETPPRPAVDLLLALPRPKIMRRLWAQLSALGLGRIMLSNAARVERNYFDTHVLSPACYRPLLLEGLQQARDTRVPEVTIHRQFRRLVEDEIDGLSDAPLRLVTDPGSSATIREGVSAKPGRVLLAVGPEGGWNAFELDLLERHAFRRVGMGPRTLRSDTACVALIAVCHEAIRES
jgi:16S rRNA (uracil1498-N3)-methyltransferase